MLHYIFLALSVLGTAAVYLGGADLSYWWILLLIPGGYVATVLVYLLALILMSLFLPMKKPIKRPNAFCRFMIWLTMDWLMKLFRIKITVKGREKLPGEPAVIVCNHRSDFDPMTVLAALRERKIAYISKPSNFKIPLVGPFIYHAGFLSIDRENGLRAVRTLKVAATRMKETGIDIGIYPEGTRSRTGKMLRFKTGAYVLAKDANAPIVVMSTKGTELVSKNVPFRPVKVEMEILEVIDRETVQALAPDELAARSREVIERNLYGAVESEHEA